MNSLVSYLFKTNAVKVCAENNPFWLTAGTLSPYFVNTHFLYGSEQDANNLLKFIDEGMNRRQALPKELFDVTKKQYEENHIYKTVIDEMIDFIKDNINANEVDYISGGERRDWFFSIMIANLLKKPHLTMYKNLEVLVSDCNFENTNNIENINDSKVLHIADLITEASSYKKMWIPIIKNIGGNMKWSVVVVDRLQGGKEFLATENVESFAMTSVDKALFNEALNMNIINKEQLDMLYKFIDDPHDTMNTFLKEHPEFMENALNADEKTVARARLCIESKIYDI